MIPVFIEEMDTFHETQALGNWYGQEALSVVSELSPPYSTFYHLVFTTQLSQNRGSLLIIRLWQEVSADINE